MNLHWQSLATTGLGLVVLAGAISDSALSQRNRAAQRELNTRAQYVQQTQALEPLYREVANSLAELAVKHNDPQLLQVLTTQGISVSLAPPPTPAATKR
jgi:hypothetical protein